LTRAQVFAGPEGARTIRTHTSFFFILAFALSWAAWIPLAVWPELLPGDFVALGLYGPSAAALILTGLLIGRTGLRDLVGALVNWRVGSFWYGFAFAWPVVLLGVALAVRWLAGQPLPAMTDAAIYELLPPEEAHLSIWQLLLPVFVFTLLGAPLGEELGWRGFALPRLQALTTPLAASLLLGLMWAAWHAPLFLIPEMPQAQFPVLWFVLSLLGASMILTWVYNATGGSLLVVVLFHAASNTASVLMPLNHHVEPVAVIAQLGFAGLVVMRARAIRSGGRGSSAS
jgi:uncharacterized protein